MSFKKIVFILLLSGLTGFLFGESEGEKLFKQNKPGEAIFLLEEEIENGTASSNAYNYLGLSYYQLGNFEKSVEVFANGLKVPATNKKILAFNQGNAYYAMKDYEKAAKSYSLAFSADPRYYNALLNRANAYLMSNNFEEARKDYQKFVDENPQDEQKEQIELMLSALSVEIQRQAEEAELAEKEAARIAEEERKFAEEMERLRVEEEKRIAEEKEKERIRLEEERAKEEARIAEEKRIEQERLAAEAERRRKLLEEVANSLHNTDSTNMSSGAEDLIQYEEESELD